ncbi:conserved hypothetical protein [Candidatus Roizmanbacteria bacterium]|nr:conserved hypothetical protein [Candidatus Roizmanbacteria bacterium]
MSDLVFSLFKKAAYTLRGRHLNRFYIVRKTLNFALSNLKPKSVTVDGNQMLLDKDDSMRLSILGVYEPLAVKHFQDSIKPGDTVLDIGAHIGYYTLMAAKRVGSKGKVYAFEPNKDNCALLTQNIKLNGFKNVVLVSKAVSKSSGKVRFFLSNVSTGMHSLVDIDNNSENSIEIEAVSLNDFFGKKIPTVGVIKMDIEGGEYTALEGMDRLLKKNKHMTILTEFSPYSIIKAEKSPRGFLNLLMSYGFKLYSIDESSKKLISIKLQKFLTDCPVDRDWHVNLLAIK